MTADQLISDAAALPPSDRLRVAQAIWDSLPEDARPAPGPEVKKEFDRRMDKYRNDPSSAMTVDQLRRRLDGDREE